MKRLVAFSIDHPLLVNLITLFIFVAGIGSFTLLNREAFPNVSYDRVIITTLYPGADPKSVEKLITIPLERELKEVNDIKNMSSISLQGRSVIVLELEPYIENTDRVVNDIQRQVDLVGGLPEDLENPPKVIEAESKRQPIIEVSLSGEISEHRLVGHAKILEKKILDLEPVASVSRKGWREKEIWVEVEPETLSEYSLSLTDFIQALSSHNVNIPGGEIREEGREYLIRSSGEFETALDVEKVVIRSNDARHFVRVRDVAKVSDIFEEEEIIHRTNGTRGINLTVIKKEHADAIDLTREVKKIVEEYQERVGDGLKIALVNDFSFYIKRRLKVLYANGFFGFLLIVGSLIFFLPARVALVTAIGVPFALFTTFFGMQLSGMTLNLLTMFGLITVLGMLVDDAIVVSENVYRNREQGMTVREACITGTLQVWKPVTTSIVTTICAFMPLMFMSGVMGKFVIYIPMMVMIALLASLFEVFLILPSHLAEMSREGKKKHPKFKDPFKKFTEKYIVWLQWVLRHRYKVALGFFGFFGVGVLLFFAIPFQLFPSKGVETFFVRAQAPVGTPLEDTARRFEQLEKLVAILPAEELDDYVLQVGIQQNDPADPFTERFSHLGQIQVMLSPPASRDREAEEIIRDLEKREMDVKGLEHIRFEMMKGGPPVGKPIAIRIRGEDLEDLRRVAQEVKADLEGMEGVKDIKVDDEKGKPELALKIDRVRVAQAGLTLQDVGMAIRASFEGLIATTIKKTDEEIDVRVRFPKSRQKSRLHLNEVLVLNRHGDSIPLSKIATFKGVDGVNAIRHYNRERAITVTANLDEKKTSTLRVHQQYQGKIDRFHARFPDLLIQFSGEFEETQESLDGLKQAFVLGALMIFMLLAVQFNSLWQPFVVMSSIPLGLVGVLIAFGLHGEPKSFLGLMGMVGLAGVVVNNAIVLIDVVNKERKKGTGELESLMIAGRLRLRPVVLTSITTVLGLFSLAYGIWGGDPFLKPMALAFVWGILFATILTLIAVPCFHAIADDFLAGRTRRARHQRLPDSLL